MKVNRKESTRWCREAMKFQYRSPQYRMKNTLLLVAVVVLSGFSVFARKLAIDSKLHPYQIQVLAGLLYGVLAPLWWWVTPRGYHFGVQGIGWGLVCLGSYVGSAVLLGILLRGPGVAVGALSGLVSASPLVTLGLSCVFLGEPFTVRKLLGCVLVAFGVGFLK